MDGLFLPPDDRRHYVAWRHVRKEDFDATYWRDLHQWYETEGNRHVTAYLNALDLAEFDAKVPPPTTDAWQRIVDSSRAPEDAELADVLDALGNPNAVTLEDLANEAPNEFRDWLRDRRNRRQIPHRLESVGYVPVRNAGAKDGYWKVDGKRVAIYARSTLSLRDRIAAAESRCSR
jgi:hypothetical protein